MLGLVLVVTVDTWSVSAPECYWMASLHIFYVVVFSDPEVDAAPSMLQLLPELVTLGNWTLRPRASWTWQFLVRCLGVLFMAQCLVQQWVHAMRQLLVLLEGFLCEGERTVDASGCSSCYTLKS